MPSLNRLVNSLHLFYLEVQEWRNTCQAMPLLRHHNAASRPWSMYPVQPPSVTFIIVWQVHNVARVASR